MTPFAGLRRVPTPVNEPVRTYAPGSPERRALKARLASMAGERVDIPLIIGGEEIRTRHDPARRDAARLTATCSPTGTGAAPSACHAGDRGRDATRTATGPVVVGGSRRRVPARGRAARHDVARHLNAATMLGQSKTVFQAEIDAACELIDFWRFNRALRARSSTTSSRSARRGVWNQLDYRPLEGFVYAVSPFNFTAIAGNLPTAPALMGNTVVWKPAAARCCRAYYLMRVLEAAGLPPGVINFVPGDAADHLRRRCSRTRTSPACTSPAAPSVFNSMWQTIGANMSRYRSYPRIVGETGGKDFIVAHPSADPQALAVAIVRGGFEYQGQKCSAASRVYMPQSLWPEVRDRMVAMMREIRHGRRRRLPELHGRGDRRARVRPRSAATWPSAKKSPRSSQGGGARRRARATSSNRRSSQTTDPAYRLMCEEIFGPVVTAYVYPDAKWAETSTSSTARRRTR